MFKILFIISLACAYGFNNYKHNMYTFYKQNLYKTVIYENNYGSEFDTEMSEDEKNFHKKIKIEEEKFLYKEIKTEEEENQYIKDIIQLQKYQTMYKLLQYLLDNQLNNEDKNILLNIFKKKINNIKF